MRSIECEKGQNKYATANDTYLNGREGWPPFIHQLCEHAIGAAFLHFSESSKDRELVVSHAHVGLEGIFDQVSAYRW
jgi:hypothetical protein